jgi:hypothetical protein
VEKQTKKLNKIAPVKQIRAISLPSAKNVGDARSIICKDVAQQALEMKLTTWFIVKEALDPIVRHGNYCPAV